MRSGRYIGGSLLCAYKQTLLLNDSSLVFSIFIMADRIMSEKIALLKSGCSADKDMLSMLVMLSMVWILCIGLGPMLT